jgi:hypothetical protein
MFGDDYVRGLNLSQHPVFQSLSQRHLAVKMRNVFGDEDNAPRLRDYMQQALTGAK